jgi:PKD repeat protein
MYRNDIGERYFTCSEHRFTLFAGGSSHIVFGAWPEHWSASCLQRGPHMPARVENPSRSAVALLLAFLVVLGVVGGAVLPTTARADSAPADPADPATPTTVSADALPTVQIDGVAWSQVVVGNTVYVGGKFAKARPAGAAAGTSETARNNLLAYDIRTGELITSFAPTINGQVNVVAAAPDGSRIYVGGTFTSANGQARKRIAAYDTATGALVSSFAPNVSGTVKAITVTSSAVYFGGSFTAVGSATREKLAAVSPTGQLLPWAPQPAVGPTSGNEDGSTATSDDVLAMVATSGGSQIVVGGRFYSVNGVQSAGVAAIDAATGAVRPFAIGQLITNQGANSAVFSLTTDGTLVYGTGYDFYGPGNLEGTFAATVDGGRTTWIADCHGDEYSVFASSTAAYIAGHPHMCSNIGGFPQTDPWTFRRGLAFSKAATGTVGTETGNFIGQPAPSPLNWYPDFNTGSVTGQSQGPWSVSGNDQYVVYGGEFTKVNRTGQQGLVRFAVPALAPNKVAPVGSGDLTPQLVSLSAGTVRVSWRATSDQDNKVLRYEVIRSDRPSTPVYTATVSSTFFDRPMLGFTDTGLKPGANYTYKVNVYDPFGNRANWTGATVTVSDDTSGGGVYNDTVLTDAPTHYWRLGESAGTTSYDRAGFDDLTLGTGATFGTAGALGGSSNTAASFDGTSAGLAATSAAVAGPQTFSVEAWFSTASTSGGKIVGFGNANTGDSSSYDRHVYMDASGRVAFGVYPGFSATVQSAAAYNDGRWHHVVASLSASGMALYLDGTLVGTRADVTAAQPYLGYWRVGGDSTWSGDKYLSGGIDEVAVYGAPLTAAQVARHYAVGTTGQPYNEPPTAALASSVDGLTVALDGRGSTDTDGTVVGYSWDLGDGTTATGPTTQHTYGSAGSRRVTLTVTDDRGKTATATAVIGVSRAGTVGGAYSAAVVNDGAASYWRFGETGSAVLDSVGTDDLAAGSGVGRPVAGALIGDADTAASFDGTSDGLAAESTAHPAPNTFSVEAWFSTTSTSGGKIVGFGNRNTGQSSSYDRHVYLDEQGRVSFGVYPGFTAVLQSAAGYNDGRWHHVVAAMGPAGMALYVDGALAGQRSDITTGEANTGYWRIGGDSSWAGATWFTGHIDDVAVYPTVLTAAQVAEHQRLGRSGAPANQAPTASFTSAVDQLTASFDGSGSTDSDGTVVDRSWDFGDGQTGSGIAPDHAYRVGGTYQVTLTVTDDDGATASVTHPVTVLDPPPPNVAPVAVFSSAVDQLSASLDGSGSSDSDGTVAGWSWAFGDSTSGSGATVSHTYAAAGTYQVTLTVTDDDGATASVTQPVTVTAPQAPPATAALVSDAFGRTVASGFGAAEVGGQWTAPASASVSGGKGVLVLGAAGANSSAYLPAVASADVAAQVAVSLDAMPTGGGTYVYLAARRVGSSDYRASLKLVADGRLVLGLSRVDGGKETKLTAVELPVVRYTAGAVVNVRLDVSGSGTSALKAKAWLAGSVEPADWQTTTTDSTAALQGAGGVGVAAFLSATATAVPATVRVDDMWVGTAGTAPSGTTQPSTPAPNVAPVAVFSSAVDQLSASLDGSGSSDSDGTVAGWSWAFGDSTSGSGATVSHTYAAAGTYQVTLTVTDDDGATASVTQPVTVTAPQAPPATAALVSDAFGRTVASGFGAAEVGGQWTAPASASVSGGKGVLVLGAAGANSSAYLPAVASADVAAQVAVSLDAMPTGGGTYVYLAARRVGSSDYRASLKLVADGRLVLGLSRVDGGKETKLTAVELPVVRYTAGAVVNVRLDVSGSGTSALKAKAWLAGSVEPADWQTTTTDSTAALQGAGGVGVAAFLSATATAVPATVRVDDMWVGTAGTAPTPAV